MSSTSHTGCDRHRRDHERFVPPNSTPSTGNRPGLASSNCSQNQPNRSSGDRPLMLFLAESSAGYHPRRQPPPHARPRLSLPGSRRRRPRPARTPRKGDGTLTHLHGTLVLGYHAVSEAWPENLSVTPRSLEKQIDALARRGYRGVTFQEAVCAPSRAKNVALTFDDGFRSVLKLGVPLLSDRGFRGTIFVATDYVGTERPVLWSDNLKRWLESPHSDELIPLSWPELRDLADAGWEIGSHSCSHQRLPQLRPAELERELVRSRARIEDELKRPCLSFCYPFGDFNDVVVQAVKKAGYTAACTSRFVRATPHTYPRILIDREDGGFLFRLKIARSAQVIRRSPAWRLMTPLWSAYYRQTNA